MSHQLVRLALTGDADSWRAAGFDVSEDGAVVVGSTVIDLVETTDTTDTTVPSGIVSVDVDGPAQLASVDGLPMRTGDPAGPRQPVVHPNRVVGFDHLVAMTPDLDRTAGALAAFGLDLRRRRDAEREGHEIHQLFYWLGDVILEVVEDPRLEAEAPARFWGLAFTVDDLDATTGLLGPLVSEPRPAVQQGRRIASLRRDTGLSVPIAFMTPHLATD